MRKLIFLVLLTGCAGTTIQPETFIMTRPDGTKETLSVAQVADITRVTLNNLGVCIEKANGNLKKVMPCMKATPTPTAAPK